MSRQQAKDRMREVRQVDLSRPRADNARDAIVHAVLRSWLRMSELLDEPRTKRDLARFVDGQRQALQVIMLELEHVDVVDWDE